MRRPRRSPTRAGALALLLAVSLSGAACSRFQPPPIELSFRDSLVGAGKIVRVENTSNRVLSGVVVTIEAPSGESRSYSRDELGPYETVEIGWKKLGGWQIPLGSRVEIGADGHFLTFKGRLPEATSEP